MPTQTTSLQEASVPAPQPSIGEIFSKRAANMNRLLSRREKDGGAHRRAKSRDKSADKKTRPLSGDGIMGLFKSDAQKKNDKDQENTNIIHSIKERLHHRGYSGIDDEQINYALGSKFADGNVDKAFEILVLFQESVEGIIKPYNPSVPMLGAVNRQNVTCYLDALLFAMFARMDNFEPILCTTLEDEPKRRLSTLIRLWVNMLRTGKLIPTDITQHLQEALAACGWEEAAKLEQQDSSEAYNFITEALKLPLLTLRMDLYHTGTEDDPDDHKYIHERLLEVAVPDPPADGGSVSLEDCLESFFNNQVDVRRYILERSNTMSSVHSDHSPLSEKEIEIGELSQSLPNSPLSPLAPPSPLSPGGRHRSQSIIRNIVVESTEIDARSDSTDGRSRRSSIRKGKTTRKEVSMKAWQFFNLIPWVIGQQNQLSSNGRIPENLSLSPAVTISLKRYGMSADGKPIRKNTLVDIPLDIRLPHFIEDDRIPEEGPMIRRFKLSLQSGLCHRGESLNMGHYISFVREATAIPDGDYQSSRRQSDSTAPPRYSEEKWLRFDDLASPRVQEVDIKELLKTEMPYLLFYRVEPIYEMSSASISDPRLPSYADSFVEIQNHNSGHNAEGTDATVDQQSYFDGARDASTPAIRLSTEAERPSDPRQSINLPEDRRGSLAFTEPGLTSAGSSIHGAPVTLATSAPVTPNEETAAQRMSRAASKVLKSTTRSRPSSQSGEGRMSGAFSRLNLMRSKDSLNKSSESSKDRPPVTDGVAEPRASITIDEGSLRHHEDGIDRSKSKKEKKKRDKSQGPSEKTENHEHHHHLHKGKGRAKDVPDRECGVM
ncbi:cysteine proteinase [Stipitochalara longipes BDJ]|nr:cysteine proteinase [Stipitochalara longipes BDJ]